MDEPVFVVAQDGELVVFFCDVEDEFGPARLHDSSRIGEHCFVGDLTATMFAFPEGYASMRKPQDGGTYLPESMPLKTLQQTVVSSVASMAKLAEGRRCRTYS
jgi:hypothetical protein